MIWLGWRYWRWGVMIMAVKGVPGSILASMHASLHDGVTAHAFLGHPAFPSHAFSNPIRRHQGCSLRGLRYTL